MSEANPLTASTPDEIPLKVAPLIRVIAQVRFPFIASIEKDEFIAPFQEAIRKEYPVLRPEKGSQVVIGGPEGITAGKAKMWRFNNAQGSWRISLASDFVALETSDYSSRNDFFGRLRTVLVAVKKHFNPGRADRLGLRYINRVVALTFEDLRILVRPELTGIFLTELGAHVKHSLNENLFVFPNNSDNMLARWGWLPERATSDPSAIEPLDQPSWILDLDAFVGEGLQFEVDALCKKAEFFSERIYTFFRWAITNDFLRRYGGEICAFK